MDPAPLDARCLPCESGLQKSVLVNHGSFSLSGYSLFSGGDWPRWKLESPTCYLEASMRAQRMSEALTKTPGKCLKLQYNSLQPGTWGLHLGPAGALSWPRSGHVEVARERALAQGIPEAARHGRCAMCSLVTFHGEHQRTSLQENLQQVLWLRLKLQHRLWVKESFL